jgi:hypothetical protein
MAGEPSLSDTVKANIAENGMRSTEVHGSGKNDAGGAALTRTGAAPARLDAAVTRVDAAVAVRLTRHLYKCAVVIPHSVQPRSVIFRASQCSTLDVPGFV